MNVGITLAFGHVGVDVIHGKSRIGNSRLRNRIIRSVCMRAAVKLWQCYAFVILKLILKLDATNTWKPMLAIVKYDLL